MKVYERLSHVIKITYLLTYLSTSATFETDVTILAICLILIWGSRYIQSCIGLTLTDVRPIRSRQFRFCARIDWWKHQHAYVLCIHTDSLVACSIKHAVFECVCSKSKSRVCLWTQSISFCNFYEKVSYHKEIARQHSGHQNLWRGHGACLTL